jgi:hypothetical protein
MMEWLLVSTGMLKESIKAYFLIYTKQPKGSVTICSCKIIVTVITVDTDFAYFNTVTYRGLA